MSPLLHQATWAPCPAGQVKLSRCSSSACLWVPATLPPPVRTVFQPCTTNSGHCRTINGSMDARKRARQIEAFQTDPPTTLFLLTAE